MRRTFGALSIVAVLLSSPAVSQQVPDEVLTDLAKRIPPRFEEKKVVVPLLPADAARRVDMFLGKITDAPTLWLHGEVKGTCSWVHAKHEHVAYITRDTPDPNGPRVAINKIVLHSNIGGDRQDKTCDNAEWCPRTEHEYALGCRRSCVSATATHNGATWHTGGESRIW